MSLLVRADSRLPLLLRTYPGNRPETPLFQSLAADLARCCRELADGTKQRTLVFDKGNNSQENLDRVARAPFYFIGSLVATHLPDLLAVPPERLRCLADKGLPGVRRTVLVTWNQKPFSAQRKTLLRGIEKRRAHLGPLQRQPRRWRDDKMRGGRKPGVAGAQKKVDG